MTPESLVEERFNGLKRGVEINGRQDIPKTDNSTEMKLMSKLLFDVKDVSTWSNWRI